jgi:two-component system phosphate regulon sensor histidine kinase PhoR
MPFRFSPKLRLAILWPAAAAILAAASLLYLLLPRVVERSAAAELSEATALLAPLVAARAAAGADLQDFTVELTADSRLRLTLIAADGRVLADSARTAEQVRLMQNHATRPEVRAALARGAGTAVRRSATTGEAYAYAARAVAGPSGPLIVRLAQPVGLLPALGAPLRGALLLAIATAVLAAVAVSAWLTRRLFAPLSRLIAGADRLAAGDLAARLEVPDEQELATLALSLNRLAATVEERIAAARAERDHLRAILAAMADGVLVTDAAGRAILVNPEFRRLFGLAAGVEGATPLEIARQPRVDDLVRRALAGGETAAVEIELDLPERRALSLTAAPLPGRGAVVVARDLTPFARLAETRRDFVANVSHELKTPLAAIHGYAETLRDGALADPATATRFTERILDSSRRLQALLEDLLTLSRLESPAGQRERQEVDLGEAARHAIETLTPAAAERGVDLELRDGSPPPLPGDPDALERLLLNLVDNALKYNRPGGRVTVAVARRGDEAVLEVADTGIGIPSEVLPRIFERFYRVDKGRSRAEGGTGLGLAIAKHVAQAHGGRIEVESEPGRGSTFTVRLPYRS